MNLKKLTVATLAAFSLSVPLYTHAQTTREEMTATPEKCGGVYYAYPVKESHITQTPKGYKPFYISHYGRHGSRYLISDNDYKRVIDLMYKAHRNNALTPLGVFSNGHTVPERNPMAAA